MKKKRILMATLLLLTSLHIMSYPYYTYKVTINGVIYYLYKEDRAGWAYGEEDLTGDIDILPTIDYDGITYTINDVRFHKTKVSSITLPNTIETISGMPKTLKNINFPNSLKDIGYQVFQNCTELNIPVILPDGVMIHDDAFAGSGITMLSTDCSLLPFEVCKGCPNLSTIILKSPVGLTVGQEAFSGCHKLETIVMFSSLTVGPKAFYDVYNLKDFYYHSTVGYGEIPKGNGSNIVWSGVDLATIHILPRYYNDDPNPVGINLLQNASYGWQNFGNYVYMEPHHLTYYVNGKEYKSYEHYCWEQITPEAFPQKEYATFSGWSEIPEYMPDNDYNVYGHFTIDEGYDNKIVVNNVDVFSGKTTGLDICLQNDGTDLTAYQFDLSLPAGFDIAKNKKGKPDVKLSDRYEDDNPSLSIEELGNGKYRFVCISMTNGVIEGTEGPLMSMNIQVPSDVTEGSYTGKVENIVMTHADETKQKLDPVSFTFNVSTYIKGDANCDLEIDVADVVSIVNYILERPSENFDAKAADVDEDGEIDVADAVKVVNMILAQVSNSTPRKQLRTVTQAPTGDGLYVEDFSIKEGEKIQISLKLKNAIDYCSFQCDLFLPEGLTIALNKKGKPDVKLDEDRMDDHSLSVEHAANGSYRLVCTSLSNAEFYENDGPIVNITVEPIADFPSGTQEGRIENTVLVETNGTKHKDFETSTFKVSFGIPTHVDTVKTNGTYDIYNLQGIKVRSNDSSTVLPKGLYITNGKKIFVK